MPRVFDCAGLGPPQTSAGLLDELGRRAALEAINAADLALFCVDLSRDDFSEDVEIRRMISPARTVIVGTKADLVPQAELPRKFAALAAMLGSPVITSSTRTPGGVSALTACIEATLIEISTGPGGLADRIAINQRHRNRSEAVEHLDEAIDELAAENDEIAAMLSLRLEHSPASKRTSTRQPGTNLPPSHGK